MTSPIIGTRMPPPRDPELCARIEKLSQYVSQNNGDMESTVRERQRGNPLFGFLFGGDGADYYSECLRRFSGGQPPPAAPGGPHTHGGPETEKGAEPQNGRASQGAPPKSH